MVFGVSKEELQKALQELRRDCYKLAAKTPRLASGMKAAFYLTNI